MVYKKMGRNYPTELSIINLSMTCRESENPIKTFQLFVNVSTYLYGLPVSYFEQTYFRCNHFFHQLIVHSNRNHSSFLGSSGYSFSFYFFLSLFCFYVFLSIFSFYVFLSFSLKLFIPSLSEQ
jgi:hypothetical protein